RDAHLSGINGWGPDALREYQEWAWVDAWDKEFENKGLVALADHPTELPNVPKKWLRILRLKKFKRFVWDS
ncbi:MAG: hypothetical protein ACREA4_12050, partial [Nitrososphaera sp.]